MRLTNSRVLIFLLFAIWIGGMLYFFTSSNSVEPLSPREHQRLVQEGKKARERDHQNHYSNKDTVDKKYDSENNIVIAKDPKQRKVLNRDTRRLENYDWKGYIKRGALKPGEDKNAKNAYNQEASEKLAWDRAIPDVRDSKYALISCYYAVICYWKFLNYCNFNILCVSFFFCCRCHNKQYDTDLPTTTIIICFHNEGRAALLRTVVR